MSRWTGQHAWVELMGNSEVWRSPRGMETMWKQTLALDRHAGEVPLKPRDWLHGVPIVYFWRTGYLII